MNASHINFGKIWIIFISVEKCRFLKSSDDTWMRRISTLERVKLKNKNIIINHQDLYHGVVVWLICLRYAKYLSCNGNLCGLKMLKTLLAKMYFRRRKVIAETILKMDDYLEIFQCWGVGALSMNIFCQKEGWGWSKAFTNSLLKYFQEFHLTIYKQFWTINTSITGKFEPSILPRGSFSW